MEIKGRLQVFDIVGWKWVDTVVGSEPVIVSVNPGESLVPHQIHPKREKFILNLIHPSLMGYRIRGDNEQILFSVEHPTEEELIQKGILGKWEDEGLAVILTKGQWYYRIQGFLAPEGEKIFIPLGIEDEYATLNELPGFKDLVAANPDLRKAVTPPLPKRKK